MHVLALGARRKEPELGPRLLPQRVKSRLSCVRLRCRRCRSESWESWRRPLPPEAAPLHSRIQQHRGSAAGLAVMPERASNGARKLWVDGLSQSGDGVQTQGWEQNLLVRNKARNRTQQNL